MKVVSTDASTAERLVALSGVSVVVTMVVLKAVLSALQMVVHWVDH